MRERERAEIGKLTELAKKITYKKMEKKTQIRNVLKTD